MRPVLKRWVMVCTNMRPIVKPSSDGVCKYDINFENKGERASKYQINFQLLVKFE